MSKSGIPIVSDIAKVAGDVIKPVAKAVQPIAPILPFIPIPGMFGLSSLLTRSLLTGALGGMNKEGKFDLKRGLGSGLLAYGVGSLMSPAAGAGASGAPTSGIEAGGFDMGGMGDAAVNFGGSVAPSAMAIPTSDVSVSPISGGTPVADGGAFDMAGAYSPPPPAPQPGAFDMGGLDTSAPITDLSTPATGTGIRGLDPAGDNLMGAAGSLAGGIGDTIMTQIAQKPLQTASLAFTGYTAAKTKEELERQREEAERILRDQENQTRERIEFAQSVLRDYPLNYQRLSAADVQKYGMAAGGLAGLTAMAKGGMPPRYLSGGGDGMSDSIPARIGGKQEARLADGEFVIPADVVSHLGNGSSNAGAKKLYAMMDRARQARTGKKRQAPAMKAERVMPA
jgi:hypothetical protein